MNITRGARPIRNKDILHWYNQHEYTDITLKEYEQSWRTWIEYTENKSLTGLEKFKWAHYTQGTSQTFDNFALRHGKDRCIIALDGEFQYHRCISKKLEFKSLRHIHPDFLYGKDLHALIISAPFSDFGVIHPEFENVMDICMDFDIPVCLDLAYWGIAKNVHIDLDCFPCIKEVTCSLSKPFYCLENHRCGIRFTRDNVDDGITMLNDVGMQNKHSMSLATHFMTHYTPDWNWETYKDRYEQACHDNDLFFTDTVIFGLGDEERHKEFNRGVTNNFRVCISEFLGDLDDS